jgi:regulator of protease activity HflC (stomatin/prohibitin superfamily)
MKTLDDALLHLQRIHGIVEQYAIAVKRNQPASVFAMNLRRQLPTLAENLKAQFGMVAEQVTSLNLSTSRGSSENQRVRALREGVAQVRQALEIAATQTKERHAVKDDKGSDATRADGSGEQT